MDSVNYQEVVGFLGYRISNDGNIQSRWCRSGKGGLGTEWRTLKTRAHHKTRYVSVGLVRDGRQITMLVHRLVLEAFVGPCPPGMECRHLDGDRQNNRLGNLCWGTKKENAADTKRHGRVNGPAGSRNSSAKLTEADVIMIRFLDQIGIPRRQIEDYYHMSKDMIKGICRGRHWKHVPINSD